MPRPPTPEIPPITAEIIAALARENDDFGFELRVGTQLRAASPLEYRHGDTYIDFRTSVVRDFDYQYLVESGWRRLQLAVECKNLYKNSPVVVCGHPRSAAESFHDTIFAGTQRKFGELRDFSYVCRVPHESKLYPAGNFVGKSVFRPKHLPNRMAKGDDPTDLNAALKYGYIAEKDSDTYARWDQAIGSAADMAIRALIFGRRYGSLQNHAFTVTLPCVVIPDGTLWELTYDDDGKPQGAPQSVDSTTLFRRHNVTPKADAPPEHTIRISHIHFLTMTGLKEMLASVRLINSPLCEKIVPQSFYDVRMAALAQ